MKHFLIHLTLERLIAASLIAEDMDAGTDKALVDRTIEGLGGAH